MLVFLGISLLAFTSGVWTTRNRDSCRRPHEVYNPNSNQCRPTCHDTHPTCDPNCELGGCECESGYILTDGKRCERLSQCRECNGDKNAKPVECMTRCPPTCEQPEPRSCTDDCVVLGCKCNKGYIKLCDDGPCVKYNECPGGSPNCGANRTYVDCKRITSKSYCSTTDSQHESDSGRQRQRCESGCVCKKGYVMRSREDPTCILKSDCSKCGRDQVHSDCANAPQPSCDNLHPNTSEPCDCQPGCVCAPGLVVGPGGKCIDPHQCPSCNGDHGAMYDECSNRCQPSCDKPDCPEETTTKPCTPGCSCKPGKIRCSTNDTKCVDPSECPGGSPTCGANETYVKCKTNCSDSCPQDLSGKHKCVKNEPCKGGCECKEGYKRNSDGQCVAVCECPPLTCTGSCEVYDCCPSECTPQTCKDRNNRDPNCTPSGKCNPTCRCKDNYYRNSTGVCVEESQCEECGENQVHSDCANAPQPSCDNLHPNTSEPCDCQPGCVCAPGLVVGPDGKCIDPHQCPSCNGDDGAMYDECSNRCQPSCDQPDCPNESTTEPCTPGCSCKPGKIRCSTNDTKCVDPSECPGGSPICGANETYVKCKTNCSDSCPHDSSGQHNCVEQVPCKGGCQCKEGHKRNSDGHCVAVCECPPLTCTGSCEVYDCCPSECTPQTCKDRNNRDPNCTPSGKCNPTCRCKDNYYRNSTGVCVEESQCEECGENQVHSDCANAPQPSCDNLHPNTSEPCDCQPGCVCAPGLVVGPDGKCIDPHQCPSCNGDDGAMYDECSNRCQPSCDQPDCPNESTTEPCTPGCSCKPGKIRCSTNDTKCVDPSECPGGSPICGANETYVKCKTNCSDSCPHDSSGQHNCVEQVPCKGGCQCKEGHKRNSDGHCVAVCECPPLTCTGSCEVYDCCPSECTPQTCKDRNNRDPNCTPSGKCNPTCRCKDNHYRDSTGVCVEESQCDC